MYLSNKGTRQEGNCNTPSEYGRNLLVRKHFRQCPFQEGTSGHELGGSARRETKTGASEQQGDYEEEGQHSDDIAADTRKYEQASARGFEEDGAEDFRAVFEGEHLNEDGQTEQTGVSLLITGIIALLI